LDSISLTQYGIQLSTPLKISNKEVIRMKTLRIREPIWKYLEIGINDGLLKNGDPGLLVEILATDPKGHRIWPHTFWVEREALEKAHTYTAKKGVKLRILKIRDLKEVRTC
jgi:hypothetical protein